MGKFGGHVPTVFCWVNFFCLSKLEKKKFGEVGGFYQSKIHCYVIYVPFACKESEICLEPNKQGDLNKQEGRNYIFLKSSDNLSIYCASDKQQNTQ